MMYQNLLLNLYFTYIHIIYIAINNAFVIDTHLHICKYMYVHIYDIFIIAIVRIKYS